MSPTSIGCSVPAPVEHRVNSGRMLSGCQNKSPDRTGTTGAARFGEAAASYLSSLFAPRRQRVTAANLLTRDEADRSKHRQVAGGVEVGGDQIRTVHNTVSFFFTFWNRYMVEPWRSFGEAAPAPSMIDDPQLRPLLGALARR